MAVKVGVTHSERYYSGTSPTPSPTLVATSSRPVVETTVVVVSGEGEGEGKMKQLSQSDKIALGVGLSIPLLGILVSVLVWRYPPRKYFSSRGSVMAWLRGTDGEQDAAIY